MGGDDDDAAMAASQVIEAVSTVLQSTKSVPELFPAMEGHLLPMLAQVCAVHIFICFLEKEAIGTPFFGVARARCMCVFTVLYPLPSLRLLPR